MTKTFTTSAGAMLACASTSGDGADEPDAGRFFGGAAAGYTDYPSAARSGETPESRGGAK